MGCDIHGWVERKVGDKYVAIKEFGDRATERNYRRFGALAGVREDGPPPRGVPPDVSDTGRYYIDKLAGDGHSHSWLPLQEAAKIYAVKRYESGEDRPDWVADDPVYYFFGLFETEPDDRVVFWFDN